MAFEVIPEAYRQPFDPLTAVDHDLVRLYTKGRLMSENGVRNELQRVYSFNRFVESDLVDRLIGYGRFLEPYTDDLDPVDETYTRTRSFNAGLALALATTANIAFELGIDQFNWRHTWAELPEGIDAPCEIKIERSKATTDCAAIGNALMEVGYRNLQGFEQPYQVLVEEVDDKLPLGSLYGNIFKASYGYVLGIGRKVLRDMASVEAIEATVFELIPDADSLTVTGPLDDEYRELIRTEGYGV